MIFVSHLVSRCYKPRFHALLGVILQVHIAAIPKATATIENSRNSSMTSIAPMSISSASWHFFLAQKECPKMSLKQNVVNNL